MVLSLLEDRRSEENPFDAVFFPVVGFAFSESIGQPGRKIENRVLSAFDCADPLLAADDDMGFRSGVWKNGFDEIALFGLAPFDLVESLCEEADLTVLPQPEVMGGEKL